MFPFRVRASALTSLLLCVCLCTASAQKRRGNTPVADPVADPVATYDSLNPQPFITVISQYADGATRLRWAPSGPSAWLQANHYGYTVERLDVDAPEGERWEELRSGIKPYDESSWRSLDATGVPGDYHLVAAEVLLGDWLTKLTSDGPNVAAARQFEEYFHLVLLVSDLSWPTAIGAGLAYEDPTAEPGRNYLYRVRLTEQPPGQYIVEGASAVLAKAEPIAPVELAIVREAEHAVTLNWGRLLHETRFTAYTIERAAVGTEDWRALNDKPYVHGIEEKLPAGEQMIVYTDTLVENYVPHCYRVIGHTPFGKTSGPSEVITAMGRDRTPPKAPTDVATATSPGPVARITWSYDAADEAGIAGFWVARNADVEGNFTELHAEILPPGTRSFVDPSPDPRGTNYYLVAAVDTAGNGAPSMTTYAMIVDSIPPERPRGLTGVADTNGVVTLRWAVSPEPDIVGYHVYFAHQLDHVFAILTGDPLMAHAFTDSIQIRTLTRDIYYYVVAVDATSNYSAPSDTLRVVKPDVVPPAPPVLSSLSMENGVVVGEWRASSSDDVERYEWLRRAGETEVWKVIEAWPGSDTTHVLRDATALAGKAYEYCIRAVDESGLVSGLAFVLEIRGAYAEAVEVKGFEVVVADEGRGVDLSWTAAPGQEIYVYRAVEGGAYDLIKRLDAGVGAWRDGRVRVGVGYEYAVQLRSGTALAGGMGTGVGVRVE